MTPNASKIISYLDWSSAKSQKLLECFREPWFGHGVRFVEAPSRGNAFGALLLLPESCWKEPFRHPYLG